MTRNFGSAIHVTEVRSFEGGPIEIRVWCTGPYSLQVTGRSALDFTYQLSSMDNADTNDIKPIHGDPVKGIIRKYNIVVNIWNYLESSRSIFISGMERLTMAVEWETRYGGVRSMYGIEIFPRSEVFILTRMNLRFLNLQ